MPSVPASFAPEVQTVAPAPVHVTIYIQFSDDGQHIRRWSREAFDGAVVFDERAPVDLDGAGRAAYAAYCAMDPIDQDKQPDWGRSGYKVEAGVWQAVAAAVLHQPPEA